MLTFLSSILKQLLNPHPRITNPEKIQQSRLLSAILLALLLLGMAIVFIVIKNDPRDIHAPEVQGAILLLAITAIMYVANRMGYNRFAAGGIILPFVIIFTIVAFSSSGKSVFLAFLLIPILLTAIFFSARSTTVISISILAAVLIPILFQDQVSETSPFWTLRNMWFFLLLATGLILTFMQHLGNLEEIRQHKLKSINEQLQQDVTMRKQAEEKLFNSEARLRALVEYSPDFILEINRAGKIAYINRFSETYLGKNVREALPPDQVDYALEVIEKAFNSGESQAIELRTVAPDNRVSWDSIRIGPIKHGKETTSLTIIMTEITAQKLAEASLREREANYRGAIIAAGFVPYSIDYQKKNFTFIGEDVYKLTGYTAQEISPILLKELIQEEYLWGANANMPANQARQMIMSGVPLEWRQDMLIRTKTGESRWLSDTSIEVLDGNGKAIGGIGIFQDITERKQAEEEREKLFKELATQNAELERFNYTISHELKSPIVTIKGFLGSIEIDFKNKNFEKAKKDLSRIASAADKMQETISDLLELSRIGRVSNPPEEVDLSKLIAEAVETLDGRIRKHNVTISVSPNLPALYTDRVSLREVFENLIDNAAKYMGNQNNPLIEIGSRKENAENIIFIKDNGMGVEEQYQTKIFGLFEKLNPASEGTGIGLALIKRIIESVGGKIWVESNGLGKGTTFYFTIPDKRGQH